MLNPFINSGLEIALKELFRDNITTEQVLQTTDIRKARLIVYVSPKSLQFVFVDEEEEALVSEERQSFLVPTYWR